MLDLVDIKEKLNKYGQGHLLQNYDKFNDEEKQLLIKQINDIDFELISKLYSKLKSDNSFEENSLIEPIKAIVKDYLTCDEMLEYKSIGDEVIKNGQYAVVTLAGGQGSRLGHNGPKGTFMVDINPPKSIFEIHCDMLKQKYEEYHVYIPWFIMTSRENNQETIAFFEKNNYFNYPKSFITFFIQGEIENILENGKIVLDKNGFIYKSSSGNGAVYRALYENNILSMMKAKGIKWIYIVGIDNILANPIDPIMIGAMIENNFESGGKSTMKKSFDEKVGVFALKNKKPTIVEYMEITEDMAKQKDEHGDFIYGDANLVSFLFSVNVIEKFLTKAPDYHVVHKKINYLDENGSYIRPDDVNGYKFESFNFDYFDQLENLLVFRVKRDEEFAPIKNKEGTDCPFTAALLYEQKYGK